ncbi:protein TIC 20-I, chloroplastic-like isoform X1 [Nymphaea colorata]|nr:protein TIC 20-I, chloroplastic-like isoform X1 [Nymphaea colorata]XP_031474429.1 protein TIC 20-I, chloroplastic-like isoform X1 [Nymphaea colorata]
MIHPGCIGFSNSQRMAMTTRLSIPMSQKPTIAGSSHLPMTMTFSSLRSLHGAMTFPRVRRLGAAHNQLNLFPPTAGVCRQHISAASSPLLVGDHNVFSEFMPSIPKRHTRNMFVSPKASKDVPSSFRYPPMTKKPRWWWRTLACLPYLMPLHETWMYAETAYHLHPFLEDFEFFTYPFLGAIGRLPSWFLMAYFFAAYLGIVRRKEWPHFFRFHVVMGMLLEIALQVVGMVSRWMPLAFYWGKIGMHFWTAVAFGYLFTVLECIKCALCGMYADIPFVCDAAYIQIPYD